MEELGKHPFNYDLNRIGDYVEDLVRVGQQKHALEVIAYIKRKYLLGRNLAEINSDRMPFYHLKNHHLNDFGHTINGTRYEDGSTYSVIFELNRLEKWIQDLEFQTEKSNSKAEGIKPEKSRYGLNKISRGIVLHYLMEYGSEKFKPTTDKATLSDYLVQIGESEETSGWQAYKEGTLAMPNERTKRPAKPGKITRKDFLAALQCLESEDETAFIYASDEFSSFCRSDLENEEGNGQKFFKN